MPHQALRGLYVPIVTPFADDGSVAVEDLERLALRLLDDGVTGLVPLGTTGEAPLLDDGERRLVLHVCAKACADRGAQLIAGVGTNDTRRTVAAVRALEGVEPLTAVLCVVPYYVRPSQDGLIAHFEAVAAASPAPVVVYNIPFRTGRRVDTETMLSLAQHENVAGTKHSVGSLDDDTQRLLAGAPDDFAVLGGDDAHVAALTLLGGAGGITASAHLCTPRWVAMVDAALDGDAKAVREHQARLLPLVDACFAEPSPAVFKAILHRNGELATPDVRLPFLAAGESSVRRAEVAIEAAAPALG